MIRRELGNPAVETGAQAPEKLVERMGDLMPGVSPSLLAEFANAQGGVVNDDVAAALGATTIAQSVIDELSSKYFDGSKFRDGFRDGFKFWDDLLGMNPLTSALVELSPVAFNEQATEALAYCGYTRGPIDGEGSLVRLRRTEAGTWVVVAWHRVWIS